MPLYEYLCEACGRTIEAFQSFSEAPLSRCDRCGGKLKKLLSPPAVQFKGSGWYVSDYGRSGSAGSKTEARRNGEEGAKKPESPGGDSSSKDSSGGLASK